MSMFLPEQTQATPTGVTEFTPSSQQTTQEDVALMQRVLAAAAANPLMIPPDLMSYILDYIQTSRLSIPIGQVFGFSQFTANVATPIPTSQSTTSASLVDLATVGPEILGLRSGMYLVLWGCDAEVAAGTTEGSMAITTGPAFTSTIAAGTVTQTTGVVSVSKFAVVTLSADTTDLKAKYQSTDGATSATFANRSLAVLRFANL